MSKKLIESLGYHVEVRSNGAEALELFKADPERFDLIITDMTMPGMTGDQLAEQSMSIRSDIPIILCTGFSVKMDEERAKTMGIRAFAVKPIVKSDIAKIIRTVLDEVEN
jgi:CheY-like chemotaxis protein